MKACCAGCCLVDAHAKQQDPLAVASSCLAPPVLCTCLIDNKWKTAKPYVDSSGKIRMWLRHNLALEVKFQAVRLSLVDPAGMVHWLKLHGRLEQ